MITDKRNLQQKLRRFYKNYYFNTLKLDDWQERVEERLREEKSEEVTFKKLEKLFGNLKNKKILDVGCGTGGFVIVARKNKVKAYGIDPNTNAISISKEKAALNRLPKDIFIEGYAEKLPFKDESFDLVYCFTVLEHVADVKKAIYEMVRVAKSGGEIYIHTPNYLSFYEGHYKIFWIPLFPKVLAKIYLSLRRKPAKFLDSINYLTPKSIKTYFSKLPVKINFMNHKNGKPNNFLEKIIFAYYKIFKVDPQIELVVEKI